MASRRVKPCAAPFVSSGFCSVSLAMCFSRSNFHEMNAPRIVCAQVVLCIGGGNKECSRTARGLDRWQSHFGALALQYLPPCVICCHRILADDQCVGIPEMLGAIVGATLINRGHRITDGEAKFVAELRNAVQVGDAWVAGLAVQFRRPLNRAIKILQ